MHSMITAREGNEEMKGARAKQSCIDKKGGERRKAERNKREREDRRE